MSNGQRVKRTVDIGAGVDKKVSELVPCNTSRKHYQLKMPKSEIQQPTCIGQPRRPHGSSLVFSSV